MIDCPRKRCLQGDVSSLISVK